MADAPTEKITLAGTPFDYDRDTYNGAGRRFWEAYRTLRVHLLFRKPPGADTIKELSIGSEPIKNISPASSFVIERIGSLSVKPKYGYSYVNSGLEFHTEPHLLEMSALKAFLNEIYVPPSESLSSHVRTWWSDAASDIDNNFKRQLQRLIVSCFDDESLVHARKTGNLKNADEAKRFYDALCEGLIDKTHKLGFAAPQHFDVLMTIVNLYGLAAMDNDLTKVFGPNVAPDADTAPHWTGTGRLQQYTTKIGQMCCGMVGSFARYATAAGRPGRFRFSDAGGVQDVDGQGPIPIIPTTQKQKDGVVPVPHRWNLSGMEGSFSFGLSAYGKDTVGSSSPSMGLTRTGLGGVRPGDLLVFQEVSHVLVLDKVDYDAGDTALVSTLESVGEGAIHSRGLTLRKESGDFSAEDFKDFGTKTQEILVKRLAGTPKEFSINHLGREKRHVSVRRLNHWSLTDPRIGDGNDGAHCQATCTCRGRHDLSNP